MKDCCYNASLLASEILAKADFVNNTSIWRQKVEWAINFVLSRQKEDGVWYYSYDPETGVERKQVDFHQGFIIVSLHNLTNLYDLGNHIIQALKKGTDYYYRFQFMRNGRSLWRLPEKWPTDIHHQSQGIITFSRLKEFNNGYLPFANMIAEWTIRKMQSYQGFFYYRKNQVGVNKIPYMRWSQGWMALALAELLNNNEA